MALLRNLSGSRPGRYPNRGVAKFLERKKLRAVQGVWEIMESEEALYELAGRHFNPGTARLE